MRVCVSGSFAISVRVMYVRMYVCTSSPRSLYQILHRPTAIHHSVWTPVGIPVHCSNVVHSLWVIPAHLSSLLGQWVYAGSLSRSDVVSEVRQVVIGCLVC